VSFVMVRTNGIRRALGAACTTVALLLAGPSGGASAVETVSTRVCDFDWERGPWHIRRLIRCAAAHWDSPGTPADAVAVARCESHLNPRAENPSGYAGLFQQARLFWPGRADRWGQPDRSVFNGRANTIVSIRMAAAAGSWSAWSGCAR
jgi:hypothetical protein